MAQPTKLLTEPKSGIEAWHICISGFRQAADQPHGIHRIWMKLGELRSPTVEVALFDWHANWREIAGAITLCSVNNLGPRINVYAYSWGAGYGLVQLAKRLLIPGIKIQHVVLADPVYRSMFLSMRWLALTTLGNISIPANVLEVSWTRQHRDWPRGHNLVAAGKDTVIHKPTEIFRGHCWMDEDPVFQSMCLKTAGVEQ